jgi:hypothetical protein
MNKPRLLPDGPNWTPLNILHPLVCEQTGDRHLADLALTGAMANGRVQSMRRRVSPRADEPEGELLQPSFWAYYQLNSDSGADDEERLLVVERASCPQPSKRTPRGQNRLMLGLRGVPLDGYVFYAWKPDYESIFGDRAESTKKPPRSAEEEQPKQGAPLKHDWIAITVEAACREANATKKQRSRSDLAEAKSLRTWCGRNLKKQPALTDLRQIVKVVRGRFRQPD